MVSNSEK